MLENITVEEAACHLPEIIDSLKPGAEIIITRNDLPIAALRLPPQAIAQPRFGSCKGMLSIHTHDDEHMQDFQECLS